MKTMVTGSLLAVALWSGAGYAADPVNRAPATNEAAVQKDLTSIVSDCEKKKLPTEQEIACIEQGYLEFMGEAAPDDSQHTVNKQ